MKFKRWTVLILRLSALTILLFCFQNCGKGFQSIESGEFASLSNLPPVVLVAQRPEVLTNLKTATLSFVVQTNQPASGSQVRCYVDGATTSVDCKNGLVLNNLVDGDHSVEVQAQDGLGKLSDKVTVSWRVDATKPTLAFVVAPSGAIGVKDFNATFTSSDNLSGVDKVTCLLNDTEVACENGTLNLTNLSERDHTIRISALDKAKNISDALIATFRVDFSLPSVIIVTHPPAFTNLPTGNFTFTGSDDGVALTQFRCQVNSGTPVACNGGSFTSGVLPEGRHTFSARAVDAAGNLSAAVSAIWSIDLTKPVAPNVTHNQTAFTKNNAVQFTFLSSDPLSNGVQSNVDPLAGYKCSLDGANFQVCQSPLSRTLTEGPHTLRVTATDRAGNVSLENTAQVTIDVTAPVIQLTQTPGATTTSTAATFSFTITEPNLSLAECFLDNVKQVACTSPKSFLNLSLGTHNFKVTATDRVGLISTQSFTWTILAPPAMSVALEWDPSVRNEDGTAAIVKGYKLRYGTASGAYTATIDETVVGNNTSYTVPNLNSGSTYFFVVTAVDMAGVESNNSNEFSYRVP